MQKRQIRKISSYGQQRWITPLGKCLFFALLITFIFWSKNHSFLSKISKKNLYRLLFSQKNKWEKVWFLDKNHGWSPLEKLAVLHFLKLQFSGLKIVFFYPKDQKRIWLVFSRRNKWEKVWRLDRSYGLSALESRDVMHF